MTLFFYLAMCVIRLNTRKIKPILIRVRNIYVVILVEITFIELEWIAYEQLGC